jgi:hypothetical protein
VTSEAEKKRQSLKVELDKAQEDSATRAQILITLVSICSSPLLMAFDR